MSVYKDFLLASSGDLEIINGDLKIGKSDQQHVEDIIESYAGWWKEYPTLGVGVQNYLNSNGNNQQLARNIIVQLVSDGYVVSNPEISLNVDGTFTINPNATRDE